MAVRKGMRYQNENGWGGANRVVTYTLLTICVQLKICLYSLIQIYYYDNDERFRRGISNNIKAEARDGSGRARACIYIESGRYVTWRE